MSRIESTVFEDEEIHRRLYHAFFTEKHRLVALLGPRGSGRTTLALSFARRHKETFSGGAYHAYVGQNVMPFDQLCSSIQGSPFRRLVILDDFGMLNPELQTAEVIRYQNLHPHTHVLAIGSPFIALDGFQSSIPLGNHVRVCETHEFLGKILRDRMARIVSCSSEQNCETCELPTNPFSIEDLPKEILAEGVRLLDGGITWLNALETSGIVLPDGSSVEPGSVAHKKLEVHSGRVSRQILKALEAEPDLIRDLSAREFEILTAEVLQRLGYDAAVTSVTRDGGKDIYIAAKDRLGSFLYLVECKKYAPENPVGIAAVQRLYGVVQAERATAGIVVTTSRFSRDAERFQESVRHQMTLVDFFRFRYWLKKALGEKPRGEPTDSFDGYSAGDS